MRLVILLLFTCLVQLRADDDDDDDDDECTLEDIEDDAPDTDVSFADDNPLSSMGSSESLFKRGAYDVQVNLLPQIVYMFKLKGIKYQKIRNKLCYQWYVRQRLLQKRMKKETKNKYKRKKNWNEKDTPKGRKYFYLERFENVTRTEEFGKCTRASRKMCNRVCEEAGENVKCKFTCICSMEKCFKNKYWKRKLKHQQRFEKLLQRMKMNQQKRRRKLAEIKARLEEAKSRREAEKKEREERIETQSKTNAMAELGEEVSTIEKRVYSMDSACQITEEEECMMYKGEAIECWPICKLKCVNHTG